jgi:hypothetical protein
MRMRLLVGFLILAVAWMGGFDSPEAAASSFWKRVTEMAIASSSGVTGPERCIAERPGAATRLYARPGRPATLVVRFDEWEILKGLRLTAGPLAPGARCLVEYSEDGQHFRPIWYTDGPQAHGFSGFGFEGWTAARYLRFTLSCAKSPKPVGWALHEILIFAEE